jgi:hypothetical protein
LTRIRGRGEGGPHTQHTLEEDGEAELIQSERGREKEEANSRERERGTEGRGRETVTERIGRGERRENNRRLKGGGGGVKSPLRFCLEDPQSLLEVEDRFCYSLLHLSWYSLHYQRSLYSSQLSS